MARRMGDWENLPKELAIKIAEHIDLYEDFETFGWVCSCWRSAVKEVHFRRSSSLSLHNEEHRLPWIMLRERNKKSLRCRFYSLSKRMVRHISLPNPLTYEAYREIDAIKLLSSHGWLLMVMGKCNKHDTQHNHNPFLLNPLSGTIIELPRIRFSHFSFNLAKQVYCWGPKFFDKFVLSANPSTTSEFSIMLSLVDPYDRMESRTILVFWRNGDDEWTTRFNSTLSHTLCEDITYHDGSFYGVFDMGYIAKIGPTPKGGHFQILARLNQKHDCYRYLVESAGKMLIIERMRCSPTIDNNNNNLTTDFKVFEFDFEMNNLKQVPSLGSRSIFIGSNSSFSLDVTMLSPWFKPNCIYYTHDRVTRVWHAGLSRLKSNPKDNGFYNLEDGKIENYYFGSLEPFKVTPLTWFESFLI